MSDKELLKRLYLIRNREALFEVLLYHKKHHINFKQPGYTWWEWDDEEGSITLDDVATKNGE